MTRAELIKHLVEAFAADRTRSTAMHWPYVVEQVVDHIPDEIFWQLEEYERLSGVEEEYDAMCHHFEHLLSVACDAETALKQTQDETKRAFDKIKAVIGDKGLKDFLST